MELVTCWSMEGDLQCTLTWISCSLEQHAWIHCGFYRCTLSQTSLSGGARQTAEKCSVCPLLLTHTHTALSQTTRLEFCHTLCHIHSGMCHTHIEINGLYTHKCSLTHVCVCVYSGGSHATVYCSKPLLWTNKVLKRARWAWCSHTYTYLRVSQIHWK